MDASLQVRDVQEREVGAVRAPAFPTPAPTGFPQPKKRTRFSSAFKQQRQATRAEPGAAAAASPFPFVPKTVPHISATASSKPNRAAPVDEKTSIDRENKDKLDHMDPTEIEEARQELMSNLDPALLQILLRRANLDDGSSQLPASAPSQERPTSSDTNTTIPTPAPAHPDPIHTNKEPKRSKAIATVVEDAEDAKDVEDTKPNKKPVSLAQGDHILVDKVTGPSDLAPISAPEAIAVADKHNHDHGHSDPMHFPQTSKNVPDLDPSDPNFLQNLHSKYFPNLPADPSRLAWMAPLPTADSPADKESPYYPGQATVAVNQLRFDFRGRLVSPKASREIPVSKGLHHHGLAPEAAGYTVGELAILARSAVPAQRCVAFQALGRILYRLGRGEWGTNNPDDADIRSQVGRGIWRTMQEGRVLETLREAASVEEGTGHRGSRAYAMEAVWLFEKGGWKEKWQGR